LRLGAVFLLFFRLFDFGVDRSCLDVPVESFHRLLLRLVHFELAHWNFVLVALAARLHLVANVHVAATASEPLLQQHLVVADLELVGCESQLVVLEVLLWSTVSISFAQTVGTLGSALLVAMGSSQQYGSLVKGWLRGLWFFFGYLGFVCL